MCLPLAQGLVVGEAQRDTVSVTELLTNLGLRLFQAQRLLVSTYEKEERATSTAPSPSPSR